MMKKLFYLVAMMSLLVGCNNVITINADINVGEGDGTVEFYVKDADTFSAIQSVRVTMCGKETSTDSNGKSTYEGVKAGSQDYFVTKESYSKYSSYVNAISKATVKQEVYLKKTSSGTGGKVVFSVNDASTGKAAANVSITLGSYWNLITNSSGICTFEEITAGYQYYSTSHSSYESAWGSVNVISGSTATVALSLTPGSSESTTGSVIFTVKNTDTLGAISSALISIGTFSKLTDSSGNCTIDGLTCGSQYFSVIKSGYNSYSSTVDITTESTATKEVLLKASGSSTSTGAVVVTVKDANTLSAVSGASVAIAGMYKLSDTGGACSFEGISSGSQTVTITKSNYENYSGTVNVVASTTTNHTASMYGKYSKTMYYPQGVTSNNTNLVVADTMNNRVLIYKNMPTVNATRADYVIGQSDFTTITSNKGGVSARSLSYPMGACIVSGKLIIADKNNHRVLIFNTIPSSNYAAADVVIGQADMLSNSANAGASVSARTLYYPCSVSTDGTNLFIADTYNNRLLIFNSVPSSNYASADIVIGQANKTSNSINKGGTVSSSSLYYPYDSNYIGNRLYIADMYNNRVLMYNSIPTADSASADVVIGQQNMTSNAVNQGGSVGGNTLYYPSSVFTDTVKILVCDRYNNRVLIFNNPPSANNTAADLVIGQPNLASNTANSGGVSAKSLYYPRIGWSGSGILFISDYMNNRVLRYNIVPSSNYALADIVIGQPNMTSNAANNY